MEGQPVVININMDPMAILTRINDLNDKVDALIVLVHALGTATVASGDPAAAAALSTILKANTATVQAAIAAVNKQLGL